MSLVPLSVRAAIIVGKIASGEIEEGTPSEDRKYRTEETGAV
jgi:hypothetical protein